MYIKSKKSVRVRSNPGFIIRIMSSRVHDAIYEPGLRPHTSSVFFIDLYGRVWIVLDDRRDHNNSDTLPKEAGLTREGD